MSHSHDFWLSCGHHLLDRDPGGGLVITDAFLKAYLARPEIVPPVEACPAERGLHARLLSDPRQPVAASEIKAIADPDARENWEVLIAFRDQLTRHRTMEAAYLDIVRRGLKLPHVFINQLVHVILRNILDGINDTLVLRAAEMFFRPQKLTLHNESLVAADEEVVSGLGNKPLSPLVSMLGLPAAAEIDVLNEENEHDYWDRSDQFDMALDLTAGRRGVAALGEVVERWVKHLLSIEIAVEPLIELRDAPCTWYVGLDANATRVGDALWKGEELDEASRGRVIAIYRIIFQDAAAVIDELKGEPVYLLAAMADDKVMRLKPQNLVTGLPVRNLEVVS